MDNLVEIENKSEEEVLKLDHKSRRKVLRIYGYSSCKIDDGKFKEIIEHNRPQMWNPETQASCFIREIFVREIKQMKRWRQVMLIYEENGLILMKQKDYKKYLKNLKD